MGSTPPACAFIVERMTRKRVAPFDPPTAADFTAHPDQVRRVRSGHQWLCAHCQQVASHLTAKNVKVCQRHGGSRHAQRDLEKRAMAVSRGEDLPRQLGRPLKHGFYATRQGVKVDEIKARYVAEGLDPDATDEDMYFLRAYLDSMRNMAPDAQADIRAIHSAGWHRP